MMKVSHIMKSFIIAFAFCWFACQASPPSALQSTSDHVKTTYEIKRGVDFTAFL
jgi:starvation-inducible outer membrane lipoprotein